MCGIAGFNWEDKVLGGKMNECLAHRGPDAHGIYSDEHITLSHRRLAIIDLSEAANQPMWDAKKECVIVFNGEIYNYKELKLELKAYYPFTTESDTEVILAGYRVWGDDVVSHLNGIFSFALWDMRTKRLVCARDHLGVKPFYYYSDESRFIFASEVKAILAHDVPRLLDAESFNEYLRVLYVPSPKTMIRNLCKLPAGHMLTLEGTRLVVREYYRPKLEQSRAASYSKAKAQVQETIHKAVERQLVADVPVGVYLSGGIDSSVVLKEASEVTPHIKTFSIGFDLDDNEEREKFNRDFDLAKETAAFYGAEHHPLTITTKDVADSLENIIGSIDDPISNPTAIPMAHLSKFAKEKVTVALSGNGGDEVFGGYERYRMSRRVDWLEKIPGAEYVVPKRVRGAMQMSALDRLAQFEFEKDKRIERVVSPRIFVPMVSIKESLKHFVGNAKDKTADLMMADLRLWLPDQALMLGDKMSMQGSLEERVPLLDREVVDLGMRLPLSMKVTPFTTKKILKDAYRDLLPPQLLREPKRGWFSPGAKWLRRPEIESIARQTLSEGYYEGTKGLFNWPGIETMLAGHIDKSEYNLTLLWAIMTFQIWAKTYMINL
jgi:asparagine synthase (glutamine-hydrolysing)